MYRMHLQTEYRKDNLQNPRTLDELKEDERGEHPGSWKKWTLSRLTEDQRMKFNLIRNQLDEEGMAYVSDNQVMRCLSKSWDEHNLCMDRLRETEILRTSNKCNEMHETEFADLIASNCIFYSGQKDTQGRPIVFVILRNFNLKKVSEQHFRRFVCFLSDNFVREMPVCVDGFILIVDAHGFGYKHMFVNHAKSMLSFLQAVQRGRQHCTCVIRGNMIIRTVQSIVMKFLDDGAK